MARMTIGRLDGENDQIGFVTITGAPYPEIVTAAREVAARMYERRFGRKFHNINKQEGAWQSVR